MTTQTTGTSGAGTRRLRRPALLGFATGFVMAFVATILALVLTVFEHLLDVLVPGALLLSPVADAMADWNGLLVMLLVGVANGVVYAVGFALVAAVARAVRRARS